MMKRHIIYTLSAIAFLTLIFVSCKNEESDIFEDSAAMRLQKYNAEYSEILTSSGGKWAMEYFCNTTEPGYLFIMEFKIDGSVIVSGLNEVLDIKFGVTNTMVTDRSAWEMISDSGPVLSFNTFNKVFHEFSDPSDIKDGKLNPDTGSEIDETGYGHRGDYEFKMISKSDNNNTLKLKGKKTGYYIYLHRLSADTDNETYLKDFNELPSKVFDPKFPMMILTDEATSEEFVILNPHTSYVTAYPRQGDHISQSTYGNAIITANGLRFREPLSIQRADRSMNPAVIEELILQSDGSLCSDNGFVLTGRAPFDLINDEQYIWSIDLDSFTGKFREVYETASADVNKKWSGKRDLSGIKFCFKQTGGFMKPVLYYEFGSNQAILYLEYKINSDGSFAWTVYDRSKDVETFIKNVPSIGTFIDLLNSSSFTLSVENLTHTSSIKFTDAADPSSSFITDVLITK